MSRYRRCSALPLVLSVEQIREIDRRAIDEYAIPSLLLMENAGRGCVDLLEDLGCQGPVTIVCGRGNNGGDGLVIARHLDLRGIPVAVVLTSAADAFRGDAVANWEIFRRCEIPFASLADVAAAELPARLEPLLGGAEWIVDALLGTGSQGAPRSPIREAIEVINRAPARKLAVDLPSGLDATTGLPADPTVRADATATFVALKPGFLHTTAQPYLGSAHVLDIGAPRSLIEAVAEKEE